MQADDLHLLGIPRSWEIITNPNPKHEGGSVDCLDLSALEYIYILIPSV